MTIGVAIIGSGIFAREQHLPAVQEASDLELKAIYSRSLKSAQGLASGLSGVEVYSDDAGAGKSYADLLAREDVEAVIVVLPILAQPQYIKQALAAGKHVLSEKPIAKDLATAQDLINWYGANVDQSKVLWGVAENFRFTDKYNRAAEAVKSLGGVKTFRVTWRSKVPKGSKYYNTEWRQTPEHQGGFILDGGVHNAAGLRLILGAGNALKTVSAQTSLQQEYLPPIDTVDAVLKAESGVKGVFSVSFGSEIKDNVHEFSCVNGLVTLIDDRLTVQGESVDIPFSTGVKEEVKAFGKSIVEGALVKQLRPEEALADLEVIETILRSGEEDGEKKLLKLQ